MFGALAFASLVWIWMLSTLESFNPANWIRILGSVWLPLGLVGSLVTGFAGRHEGGRGWIAAGLSLSAVTLAGFLVLLSTAG